MPDPGGATRKIVKLSKSDAGGTDKLFMSNPGRPYDSEGCKRITKKVVSEFVQLVNNVISHQVRRACSPSFTH